MKTMKHLWLVAIALLAFTACSSDDDDNGNGNGNGVIEGLTGVFVANEGPFNQGSGSLTLFNPETQTVTQDLFESTNQTPIGNIFQSMTATPDHFVLVANNSGLVRITDNELSLINTIDDLASPRYALQSGPSVVAISDWGSNAVHFYDEADWSSLGSVSTNTGPDRMLLDPSNGNLWVVNSGGFSTDSTVTRISAASRSVIGDVATAGRPNSLVRDANGDIWVLCGGTKDWNDPANNEAGALIRFSPEGDEQERLVFSDASASPSRLNAAPNGSKLYWTAPGGVYAMSITSNALPTAPWVDGSFYALGVDPSSGKVYASDAKDFASNGEVRVYSENGQLSHTFAAGIIPGNFTFK
jgi:hypothetical protein